MEKSQFESHDIWNKIADGEQMLSSFSREDKTHPSFKSAQEQIKFIRWTLNHSDPRLVSTADIDNIQGNSVQHIVNTISNSRDNVGSLDRTEQYFANFVKVFPYPRVRKIYKSDTLDVADEFRNEISVISERLSKRTQETERSLQQSISGIGSLESKIEEAQRALASLQASIDARIEELSSRLETVSNERLNEINAEFEKQQSARRSESDEVLSKLKATLDAANKQISSLETEANRTFENANIRLLKELEATKSTSDDYLEKIKNIFKSQVKQH